MEKGKIYAIIFLGGLIIAVGLLCYSQGLYENMWTESWTEICEMLGYNKSTDHHITMNSVFQQVECDGVMQDGKYLITTTTEKSCLGYNKWGECLGYNKTKYRILLKGDSAYNYEIKRVIR